MYTYKEAQKIFDYYSDKVIGRPLDKIEAPTLLITELKIVEIKNNKHNVFCYARASVSSYLYRNIQVVVKDLELISPSEVLEK